MSGHGNPPTISSIGGQAMHGLQTGPAPQHPNQMVPSGISNCCSGLITPDSESIVGWARMIDGKAAIRRNRTTKKRVKSREFRISLKIRLGTSAPDGEPAFLINRLHPCMRYCFEAK